MTPELEARAREAFEAMHMEDHGNPAVIEREPEDSKYLPGRYKWSSTEQHWETWLKSWKTCAASQVPKDVGEVVIEFEDVATERPLHLKQPWIMIPGPVGKKLDGQRLHVTMRKPVQAVEEERKL